MKYSNLSFFPYGQIVQIQGKNTSEMKQNTLWSRFSEWAIDVRHLMPEVGYFLFCVSVNIGPPLKEELDALCMGGGGESGGSLVFLDLSTSNEHLTNT